MAIKSPKKIIEFMGTKISPIFFNNKIIFFHVSFFNLPKSKLFCNSSYTFSIIKFDKVDSF